MATKQKLWSAEELEALKERVLANPEVSEIVLFVGENTKALGFVESLLEFFTPTDITLILRAAKKAKLFDARAYGRKGKVKR